MKRTAKNTIAILAADFEDSNLAALPKLAPHEFLAAHLENIGMSARTVDLITLQRAYLKRSNSDGSFERNSPGFIS